ncbi:MAG: GGDEF domain-containing protein, partial [Polyangia bacterium]|nr:GGDEF domain-containing protein [Polyangia bacterium]
DDLDDTDDDDEVDDEYEDDDSETTRVTVGPDEALVGALKNQHAYLIAIAGTHLGEMHKVEGTLDIGRDKSAGIRLVDDGISRRHCQVRQLPMGKLLVKDLGSTNGTFANGKRIDSEVLSDGDKIQIGSNTILKFAFNDGLDEDFQRQMYESALRDGLTKAYNKRYFTERVEAEFTQALRARTRLALIMMDIDHFKKLNDSFGHPAGDFALQALVKTINPLVGEDDIFCRYGGEEFVVITKRDEAGALALAEAIRRSVEEHEFLWEGTRLAVTLSLGMASIPGAPFKSTAELLGAADAALYRSKQGGRNRVTVHGA